MIDARASYRALYIVLTRRRRISASRSPAMHVQAQRIARAFAVAVGAWAMSVALQLWILPGAPAANELAPAALEERR